MLQSFTTSVSIWPNASRRTLLACEVTDNNNKIHIHKKRREIREQHDESPQLDTRTLEATVTWQFQIGFAHKIDIKNVKTVTNPQLDAHTLEETDSHHSFRLVNYISRHVDE